MSGQPASKLETLPAELGLSILRQIPDTKTLHSLIQASPVFHSLYLADRERIFTEATINELYSKDVDILGLTRALVQVIFEPDDRILIHLYKSELRNELRNAVQEAIHALYAQDGNLKEHVVLSINSCKALLMIRVIVKWEIVEEGFWPSGNDGKHAIVRPDKVLNRDDFFWGWCIGNNIITPGEDQNNERFWILRWAVEAEDDRQKLLVFGNLEEWEAFRCEKRDAEALHRGWFQTERKIGTPPPSTDTHGEVNEDSD